MKIFITKMKISKSGFTFLELMIVIAIVGILSGIAAPNFIGSKNDSMLKNAARGLLGDIQKTRMGAIKDNENWFITFQPGTPPMLDSYTISYDDGIDTDGDGTIDEPDERVVKKTVIFTDKKSGVIYGNGSATKDIPQNAFGIDYITYPDDVLVFQPDGKFRAGSTGSSFGNGYVYLTNGKGTVFGIGTLASGVVIFKQWIGSNWSN